MKSRGDGDTIVIRGPDTVQYLDRRSNKGTILKCLPDTVDPRGPRGK